MSRLTNCERETIASFNEGEDDMSVYTHSPKLRRRLERLARERPGECRLYKVTHWGEAVGYYIPKSWLRINPTRLLTGEQRAAMAQRGKNSVLFKKSRTIIRDGDCAPAGPGRDIPRPPDGGEEDRTVTEYRRSAGPRHKAARPEGADLEEKFDLVRIRGESER